MSSRSLNKVQLIGNLTRDPELRYTPNGTAVCTIGLATNRSWTTDSGEKREETEFHRLVAWNKLAELCGQLLVKGRKIYIEGRLQTRSWTAQDGTQRTTTEIVIDDMILLDSRKALATAGVSAPASAVTSPAANQPASVPSSTATTPSVTEEQKEEKKGTKEKAEEEVKTEEKAKEDINADDIPF